MRHEELRGWNVGVERVKIRERGDNGEWRDAEGWALVFTEVIPQTANTITFKMSRDLRDAIVRDLTGGIVLAGGELPKI